MTNDTSNNVLTDKTPICLSGGAEGSDLQWGMTAGKAKHVVYHWSFTQHKTLAPENEVVILTQDQLDEADPYLEQASATSKRKWVTDPPRSLYVKNLLRRNWYQVKDSGSCYAVSSLSRQKFATQMPVGHVVKATVNGGTGWAVEMFINQNERKACPCFVFDQNLSYWFEWIGDGWSRIYEPPKPTGVWAGIGTRDLNPIGKLAIRVLMDYEFNYHAQEYPWAKNHKYA